MTTIYLWGDNAQKNRDELVKGLRMKWNRGKRRFYRENVDRRTLSKITSYCMKKSINYKTDEGHSYEVIPSEVIETSSRELRDWDQGDSKSSGLIEEIDYEQMWDEYKEEE